MSEAEFVYPNRTRAVSVTRGDCSLNCAHCSKHYLGGMCSLGELEDQSGFSSILASGGCNLEGEVPLLEHSRKLANLKEKYRIVAHTGLVPPRKAREVASIADVISFDFPPSTRAIREVFGISKTQEDYLESLSALSKHARVVPHITIGLLGGKISGEKESLELISGLEVKTVVMNVLVPTPGTRFESTEPPGVDEVVSLLGHAKKKFDKVYLGCMRPGGEYRVKLDEQAIGIVDRIVMPARGIGNADAKTFDECCAL
ncbi:MAG: radical SAM protein [Candidatus Micrarchaeota archaeon]